MGASHKLRKHADYQNVYRGSRKQFSKQMSYFFRTRNCDGTELRETAPEPPRVGLTVGKVIGKAVDRNRIKRRLREAVRRQIALINIPVDIVLHPRRSVIDVDFADLEREIASVFRAVRKAYEKQSSVQGITQ